MDNYPLSLREEEEYLAKTIEFISREMAFAEQELATDKKELIATRQEMWENAAHCANDFGRLTEMNQFLSDVKNETINYLSTAKRLEKYRRIINSPYFGRFDFREDGFPEREKVYIGLANVMDRRTKDVYVYDWRAPIAGIFYRYEPGPAAYDTPAGESMGEVLLKRQYKIRNSQLKYFFDCSIRITDEVLQEILTRNSSPKMRSIVETIQKEQDLIIRDTANELLLVQGVAGSGKTSIALHRVAFLLYEGLKLHLNSNNVIIISPNDVFTEYISKILPELGEENVVQTTFDEISSQALAGRFRLETRSGLLETTIRNQGSSVGELKRASISFKGSKIFVQILDQLLWYYAHQRHVFEDVYCSGMMLETKQELKNRFLNNKIGIPPAKQLKRIAGMLLEKVHPLQKENRAKIEKIVANSEGHELEIKSYSRLLSIKKSRTLIKQVERFTRVDYWQIYLMLFREPGLLPKLARGLELPADIEEILALSGESLENGRVPFEDIPPLLYLKFRAEGADRYPEIRQVVIDEAQDYSPLQYAVFKLLFPDAKYTVLGDIHQSILREGAESVYDDVAVILAKPKTVKLRLEKGYRSTYEINAFSRKLLGADQDIKSYERHGEEPAIVCLKAPDSIEEAIAGDLAKYAKQGYESIAIIGKTQTEAEKIYTKLKNRVSLRLIKPRNSRVEKGVSVISAYLAKGLEFDVVLVYGADNNNYCSVLDRQLLYIACTRALHRLRLYYTGERSPFI